MGTDLTKFDGGIPENYDRGLGPHIFVDFGADLAGRVAAARPPRVLELASGTGIVTRLLRDALDGSSELVATDLSDEMLAVSREKFDAGEPVRFQQADAMELPFDDGAFDAVCCQFGVMFFPDKEASYREALRVLQPEGRYVLNTWSSWDHNPFARIAFEVVVPFFPDDPPEFYKLPFSYHDGDEVVDDLRRAGFNEVRSETLTREKTIEDFDLFTQGLVFGNPLAGEIRDRGGVEPETVRVAIAEAFRDEFGDEPTSMPLCATVFEASRSQ